MRHLVTLSLLFISMSATWRVQAADDGASHVMNPGSVVAGASLGQWTERWWEWAFSMPVETSAIADQTGEHCGTGQFGPVWFLAGSYRTTPIVRTCAIPAGKHVFFPVINYVVTPRMDQTRPSCNGVTQQAEEITDDAEDLRVTINGKDVRDVVRYRERSSRCFNAAARSGTGANIYPSASNGYWIMLRPLPKGQHRIEFSGRLGDFSQSIAYKVLVR